MSNVVLFHQCSTIKVDVSMDPLIRLQIYRRPVHFTASFILRETRVVHTFQEMQIPSQVQIQTHSFQEIKMPSTDTKLSRNTNAKSIANRDRQLSRNTRAKSIANTDTHLSRNTNTKSCANTETKNLESKLAFFKLFKNGTTAWQKEEVTGASRRL